MKKIAERVWLLVLVMAIAISFAQTPPQALPHALSMEMGAVAETSLQTQIDLLDFLFANSPDEIMKELDMVSAMGERVIVSIPNITLMATPDPKTGEGRFLIGLDEYPTKADRQFILDFTGIPEEYADITQFIGITLEAYHEDLEMTECT